jgi:predicted anti-sigma-YlaC factor YlaD
MRGSKMNCKRVEDLLSMYIENELPGELHREISLHLEHCDQCRVLREKIEELIYVFPELEEEVPFFLKNRLYYIPESQEVMEERVVSCGDRYVCVILEPVLFYQYLSTSQTDASFSGGPD